MFIESTPVLNPVSAILLVLTLQSLIFFHQNSYNFILYLLISNTSIFFNKFNTIFTRSSTFAWTKFALSHPLILPFITKFSHFLSLSVFYTCTFTSFHPLYPIFSLQSLSFNYQCFYSPYPFWTFWPFSQPFFTTICKSVSFSLLRFLRSFQWSNSHFSQTSLRLASFHGPLFHRLFTITWTCLRISTGFHLTTQFLYSNKHFIHIYLHSGVISITNWHFGPKSSGRSATVDQPIYFDQHFLTATTNHW